MIDRVYLPSAYVDDICPPPRSSPSDWIVMHGGAHHLAADRGYRAPDPADRPGVALADGDVVSFDWREDGPGRTLTVRIDEAGRVSHDPIGFLPAGLNMFWADSDPDTMVDTLQGFLDAFHDLDPLEDGQKVDLCTAEWGDEAFRFVVDGAGARFVPADIAPRPEPAQASLPGLSA